MKHLSHEKGCPSTQLNSWMLIKERGAQNKLFITRCHPNHRKFYFQLSFQGFYAIIMRQK